MAVKNNIHAASNDSAPKLSSSDHSRRHCMSFAASTTVQIVGVPLSISSIPWSWSTSPDYERKVFILPLDWSKGSSWAGECKLQGWSTERKRALSSPLSLCVQILPRGHELPFLQHISEPGGGREGGEGSRCATVEFPHARLIIQTSEVR
jgi:hypothetical protein